MVPLPVLFDIGKTQLVDVFNISHKREVKYVFCVIVCSLVFGSMLNACILHHTVYSVYSNILI